MEVRHEVSLDECGLFGARRSLEDVDVGGDVHREERDGRAESLRGRSFDAKGGTSELPNASRPSGSLRGRQELVVDGPDRDGCVGVPLVVDEGGGDSWGITCGNLRSVPDARQVSRVEWCTCDGRENTVRFRIGPSVHVDEIALCELRERW